MLSFFGSKRNDVRRLLEAEEAPDPPRVAASLSHFKSERIEVVKLVSEQFSMPLSVFENLVGNLIRLCIDYCGEPYRHQLVGKVFTSIKVLMSHS